MSHALAFAPAEHGDRIIGCNANEGDIARFLRAIQRDREAVTVDNRRRRRGAEALRQVVPRPAGRFVMAGEDRGIDEHIAFDTLHAGFFSVATILRISCRLSVGSPPKRAIRSPFSTPPSREPLVSSVVVKRKSGPSCSSAASAVMTFAYWPGAPFAGCDSRFPASMRRPLRHKGKVRTGGKLVDVLVNIRRLSAKRYTGGQSDDKSGKSHNLALTT